MRTLRGRALAVAAALLIATLYLLPTFVDLPEWWGKIFPVSRIRLGLDLQGGLYLTLEVKVNEAITTHVDQSAEALRRALAREGMAGAAVARKGIEEILVTLPVGGDLQRARQILSDTLPDFALTSLPGQAGPWRAALEPGEAARIREGAVQQALATLRSRIDQYGVTEPTVQRQGEARIVLQLPGVQRPEEVQRLIGTTARLEFKEIDDTSELLQPLLASLPAGITLKNDEVKFSDKKEPLTPPYLVSTDMEKLGALVSGHLPSTHQILIGEEPGQVGGKTAYRTYLLKSPTLMTGEGVVEARVRFAPATGAPVVVFEFDDASAERFAELTESLKGRRMAVIVDGIVRSAPVIEQRIAGGRAQIAGRMNDREARDLAIMLRTGALRASVARVAQRSVGPSLGRDSVMSGLLATLAGLAIVLIFMMIYYRTSGLFADAAVLFNMALVLAALAAFDATLTLPGIAGLALTVGMAVDANVLVLERIRDEVRLGKTFRAAVDAGYDRAYRTILDANATTLLAALILYYYGVGPVRGFAVTLSLGIGGTLFTSLIFTRLLFHMVLGSKGRKRIAI
jgi:protein-export membrane protein SecD